MDDHLIICRSISITHLSNFHQMQQNEHVNDLQLIEQIKNRDIQALAVLYTRYHKPLVIMARTLSPNKDEASDIVTEVLLSLLKRGKRLKIKTSVKTYLYKAVRYRCITMYALTNREDDLLKEYGKHLTDYEPALNRMEVAEIHQALQTALNSLPAQMKKAIELSYLQEKGKQEVATALGIEPSTLTKYIKEALTRLRQIPGLKNFY